MTARKIVVASGNLHKIEEIRSVLPEDFELVPQTALSVPSPEETGLTFVENAIIKARNAASISGLAALADDSGLEVDFLDAAPGIYSSRYAGASATDQDNNEKLLAALEGVPPERRTARFQCIIVYMRHGNDPTPLIASGRWEGVIQDTPRGQNGFGYDPLFFVPELGRTAAELTDQEKSKYSHRGRALGQLKLLLSSP